MKIIVISLKTSVERRESIRTQFGRLEVPFDFFDAVMPADAASYIERYDESEFFRNCGRHATETEIACYASHLSVWRQCADEGVPYLILEDDARLDTSFLTGLLVASIQIRKLGFLRVSLPNIRTALRIDHLGPFDIQYCRRAPLLALGYALAPDTARQLANAGAVVEEPIDKFMQRFWRHGQPVFALTPPCVDLAGVADDSDIGVRSRHQASVRHRVLRATRKIQNSIQRTAWNFKFVHGLLRE